MEKTGATTGGKPTVTIAQREIVRQPRSFESDTLDLNDKVVLVTGGTGSFGQAFVKTVIARYRPRKLIVFSRDELKQYEMAQEFGAERYPFMRYFIGDVRNRDRLEMALRDVDYVIHAAAMKHVPIAEYNPFECIHTNVVGAENIVNAAISRNVRKVIALSTDKAANPVSLYGASKLAADKIFVAANNLAGEGGCRFAVVRYGNVLGSRGGVVDYFQKLAAEQASEIPITDKRMTRFWITLQQGVDFVLSSLDEMAGGEIFVPKIPSMGIIDFAKTIAPGIRHNIVGARAGEKLHEVMIPEDDARTTYEFSDKLVVMPAFAWWTRSFLTDRGAKLVPEDYRYASDSNQEWLSAEGLHAMLEQLNDG
jgi:UDP-N-acetylglucosamine 4,6-dehydratase